jgi:hypothetical protein
MAGRLSVGDILGFGRKLYGLTPEEIKIVEATVKLGHS